MRKLSELLPIARRYLCPNGPDEYTCHAADTAADRYKMDRNEANALRYALEREINKQRYGASAIASIADARGVCSRVRHPEYIAFRDKWLDEFQSKLEVDEQHFAVVL